MKNQNTLRSINKVFYYQFHCKDLSPTKSTQLSKLRKLIFLVLSFCNLFVTLYMAKIL